MIRVSWRGIFLPLLIIIFFSLHAGTFSKKNLTGTVKINILSKHIRILKEKRGVIKFHLPPGTLIREGSREFYSPDTVILYSGDRYKLLSGEREINSPEVLIYTGKPGQLCRTLIENDERAYPLPLEIIRKGGELNLYITEEAGQYAMDSARAELGPHSPLNGEALQALALAVHGRCMDHSLRRKHRDADFCDLTCCSNYRGRSGLPAVKGPFIDSAGTGTELFFHSSSGGRLFSEAIFSRGECKITPPKDIIYSENLLLSRRLHHSWESVLPAGEASKILYPGGNTLITGISFDPDRETAVIRSSRGSEVIAPEDLRLRINRFRGWNFIKSNNYTLTPENGEFRFRGRGLGHGTGLSMDGAMELAEKGYSRYEILEHYYPGIKYLKSFRFQQSSQYVTFDLNTGGVIHSSSGPAFIERRIPCGSIFKLFTALYMAQERRDLFFSHRFRCREENRSPLPHYCWERKGHGEMNIESGLYSSCNVYFASLHDKIDRRDFNRWFSGFRRELGLSISIPESGSEAEWGGLLAGLDSRTDISVSDLIKLTLFIFNSSRAQSYEAEQKDDAMGAIRSALKKTFTHGTARITEKEISEIPGLMNAPGDMRGKTGTFIAGTNSHHSYGIFMGVKGDRGIITLVRKGKGADAAHLSILYLQNMYDTASAPGTP